ncbi:hypothetical protein KSF_104420 [Reticulibacter mediterranei]|uniref:DinB-like domain-containing protein n=1 Tax=Reticulibacter mediterranei TaxID=2778369 RepID=A0A8J3IR16_9CHLR|nr:DinB family protein [Reticulibacter mediterranei]GHP00395.1 hypothetical protein KSF_104420 [Reticulibacter mediterranei]
MTEQNLSLSSYYRGWNVYQQHLVKMIEPLSVEQLALRAAPHLWSVGMVATHIVATRAGWFHNWMGEGSPEMAVLDAWDDSMEPLRLASELVAGLESSWQMIQSALERWKTADLVQTFDDPRHRPNRPALSRQWIIWHVLEHDMHHGGEISFALGMHGLAAIDL